MKRKLAFIVAAFLLVLAIGVPTVTAAEIITDTVIADFESEASREKLLPRGQYNFWQSTASHSQDVKASGDSAVRITYGNGGDTIEDMRYDFGEAGYNLSKVSYISFYIKNESATLPLGFRFYPFTLTSITAENVADTENEAFWKDHLGTYFVKNRPGAAPAAKAKAKGAAEWSEASTAAVGDSNGGEAPFFTVPASFEGYIKIELDSAERVKADGSGWVTDAFTWRGAQAYKNDATKAQVSDYNGISFVIDDITLGISSAVVIPQPEAPEGLAGVAPTSAANNDGKITGVTTAMEYKQETATSYTAVTGTEITGLSANTYLVRLKEDGDTPAGKDAKVIVPAYVPPKAQDFLRMVNDFETTAKIEQIKGAEYTFLGGADFIPSKSVKATGTQSAMITLQPDTNNGFQRVLVSTPLGDLSKASFVQFYVKWSGTQELKFNDSKVDSQMGTPQWYNQKKAEDPNWEASEAGIFWKKHIIIGGHVNENVVGEDCISIFILQNGKWVEKTDRMLPAKFDGLVRFYIPDSAKKANRAGMSFTLENNSDKLAGDFFVDDVMVGMTGVEAAAGYSVKFLDYAAEAGIKVDEDAGAPGGPGNVKTGDVGFVPAFIIMLLAATFVICSRKRIVIG